MTTFWNHSIDMGTSRVPSCVRMRRSAVAAPGRSFRGASSSPRGTAAELRTFTLPCHPESLRTSASRSGTTSPSRIAIFGGMRRRNVTPPIPWLTRAATTSDLQRNPSRIFTVTSPACAARSSGPEIRAISPRRMLFPGSSGSRSISTVSSSAAKATETTRRRTNRTHGRPCAFMTVTA